MKEKRIAAIKRVVALAFGLIIVGCASSPPMPLSQAEMRLDDPRMPPDRFGRDGYLNWYWAGTRAPELPADQVSIFIVPSAVSNLRIDGRSAGKRATSCFMYLPPGKHTLTFSYYEERRMESYNGTYLGDLTINFPDNRKEMVMEAGKKYGVYAIAGDVKTTNAFTGSKAASSILIVDEWPERYMSNSNWEEFGSYSPPALRKTKSNYKYLEPYDSSIPLNQQAFLEARNEIYFVGFNGETVSWGWGDNCSVAIGIPSGRHELQLVKDKIHYAMTIDCLAGTRYVFWFSDSDDTIIATNITGSPGIGATKAKVAQR